MDTVAVDYVTVADALGVPIPTSVQELFVIRCPSPAAFVTPEEFDGLMAAG
ncbi:hypothetical protein [Actinosynnema sp. NPDC023587]|uniref:hypothetical protein n=1 Tax=Actinosynnema sp. NPDC023587 TaxID=3154695 RepID=UPI0033E1D60F